MKSWKKWLCYHFLVDFNADSWGRYTIRCWQLQYISWWNHGKPQKPRHRIPYTTWWRATKNLLCKNANGLESNSKSLTSTGEKLWWTFNGWKTPFPFGAQKASWKKGWTVRFRECKRKIHIDKKIHVSWPQKFELPTVQTWNFSSLNWLGMAERSSCGWLWISKQMAVWQPHSIKQTNLEALYKDWLV